MTDAAESVVNGMSPSLRNSPYANSGLVTEVRLDDFAHLRDEWGELAGLRFQQMFEETARLHGGAAQVAPAQRVADFVAGRPSRTLPAAPPCGRKPTPPLPPCCRRRPPTRWIKSCLS